jgi:predicted phage tail protein
MNIDTRPQIVDIQHYAGDTLSFQIDVNEDVSTGTWAGQIRTSRGATVDAEFSFTPNAGGTAVILSATDSSALAALGVPVVEGGISYNRYTGVYDVQLLMGTTVSTFVRGTITVDSDVTVIV